MKATRISNLKNVKGFSLIEVLIAVTLTVILGAGILTLQYILTQNQVNVWRNYLNVNDANTAVTTLIREIRNIRPGDNGAYPIEKALDQEIIFYSDVDYDGKAEKVRYSLNGTQLIRGVIKPEGYPVIYPVAKEKVKPLADFIRNGATPIYYYYNGDWPADIVNNPLIQPVRLSDTKLMRIYLVLNKLANKPDSNFVLESDVQLRMLKNNL